MHYSLAELESFASRFYMGRKLLLTPYGYTLNFLALLTATTQTANLNIAANADFMLLNIRSRAVLAASQSVSSKTAPLVRMLITDSGSNEQFTNSAVDLENYTDNGVGARTLFYPRMLAGRTSLTVAVSNYSSATVGAAETYTSLDVFFSGLLLRAYSDNQ